MKKLIKIIIRTITNAIFAKAYAVEFRQIKLPDTNAVFYNTAEELFCYEDEDLVI